MAGEKGKRRDKDEGAGVESLPLGITLTVYVSFTILILWGYVRDFFRKTVPWMLPKRKFEIEKPVKGYAPLLAGFEDFFTRRLYRRSRDCWNRPISSAPGPWIDVMERESDDYNVTTRLTGNTTRCLNLASYNYLGFADPKAKWNIDVVDSALQYGPAMCSPRAEAGTTKVHQDLETTIAKYVGKPAALVVGMGFATNAFMISALCQKGTLIISDSLNHASIVVGARASESKINVFKHNDAKDLEKVVQKAIVEGQPRTHRPWKKIVIIVEGLYSMEGEICCLKEIVEIKKKYKCYLYVDEAHSIGALGKGGRGVCEYFGVDPADVDVLMGTFTKSFGSVGGYIASSEEVVKYLRCRTPGYLYATAMAPPCAQQALTALRIILGEDGTDMGRKKIAQLRSNSMLFRKRLKEMGCLVLGDDDSPIIPVMLYAPAKMPMFSRHSLERNLAVVVVGFPATPLLEARVRFCLSAGHTTEDLEHALKQVEEVVDICALRYMGKPKNEIAA
uniref:serine C-palmitoyltransferase n=1 Tax=Palpitomonas bilix TaxID=652834 RepID=A0A7S3DA04_9EUKA|mmetsp:Transcript_28639/g.73109  ORF Transcript_28639/g.73109 Transcript_28639/m.73109 type:complete len:505 (+) Transcript_28639:74-1588(+)